jgi:signal transduction histidine kinase
MIGLRRALLAIAVAGAAAAGAVTAIEATSADPALSTFNVVSVPVIGLAWIAAGLAAWLRRPQNRTGPLMTIVGFTWMLAGIVELWSVPAVVFAGYLVGPVFVVATAHVALAFPSGRLPSKSLRALVAGLYAAATVGQLPGMLLVHLSSSYKQCEGGCPHNPLLVHADKIADHFVGKLDEGVGALLLLLVVRALVLRWRHASVPRRRLLAPVLWPTVVMLVLLIAVLVGAVFGIPQMLGSAGWIAVLVAFGAIPFAFLIGLVRTRVTRAGAVEELMSKLEHTPARGELRDALAAALGDPSIELAYWLPHRQGYVDADGGGLELPQGGRRAVAEIEHDGRPVAAIVHDATLLDQPQLIRSVGAAAALALENERLEAELRAQIQEVRASRTRLVEAQDTARRRLERSLHDGAQQRLASLALSLRLARSRIEKDPSAATEMIEAAEKELGHAIDELRELARGIHPAVLTDRGLAAALESLVTRSPMPVEVAELPKERLPPQVESAAYLVVAEALRNSSRYADATGAVVRVAKDNGLALVEVKDDGVGGADPSRGTGLRMLGDRLSAIDGSLEVVSAPGEGTIVYAEIPCA